MTLLEKFQKMYLIQYSTQKRIFDKIIERLEYAIEDYNCNHIIGLQDSDNGLLVTKFSIGLIAAEKVNYKEFVVKRLFKNYLEEANIEVESIEIVLTEEDPESKPAYHFHLDITLTTVQSLPEIKEEDN